MGITDKLFADTDAQTRVLVFEALDAAVNENDYPLMDWDNADIADDLVACCGPLEARNPRDLVPMVQEWKTVRQTQNA